MTSVFVATLCRGKLIACEPSGGGIRLGFQVPELKLD